MEYKGSIIRRKNGKCSSNDIFIFYGADTTQGFPGKHGRLRMGPGLLGRDVQLPPAQQPPESRTMGEIRRFDTGLLQAEERGEASETAAAATIKAGWTQFWNHHSFLLTRLHTPATLAFGERHLYRYHHCFGVVTASEHSVISASGGTITLYGRRGCWRHMALAF